MSVRNAVDTDDVIPVCPGSNVESVLSVFRRHLLQNIQIIWPQFPSGLPH